MSPKQEQQDLPKLRTKIIPFLKGVTLVALGVFLLTAIFSYGQEDASFKRASDTYILNLSGAIGAFIADPMLQFAGAASILFALSFLVWGGRTIAGQKMYKLWITLPSAGVMLFSLSGLCAFMPVSEWWPFYVSMGGAIGDYAVRQLLEIIPEYAAIAGFAVLFLGAAYITLQLRVAELVYLYRAVNKLCALSVRGCYLFSINCLNLFRKILKRGPIEAAKPKIKPKKVKVKEDIVEYKPEVKKKKVAKQTSLKLSNGEFELPDADLLTDPERSKRNKVEVTQKSLAQNAKLLKKC